MTSGDVRARLQRTRAATAAAVRRALARLPDARRLTSAVAIVAIVAMALATAPAPTQSVRPVAAEVMGPTPTVEAQKVDGAGLAGASETTTPTPDPWAQTAERCGAGRWAVRTMGDADVSRIDLGTVVTARVSDLTGVRRPLAALPAEGRLGPVETTLFSVSARLLEVRRTAEGDLQLAIADPDGSATLVVQSPDASCLARTPADLRRRIDSAAEQIAACGPIGSEWTAISGEARIVAPGYWADVDPPGPATNGLQLSTPLAFERIGACNAGSDGHEVPANERQASPA